VYATGYLGRKQADADRKTALQRAEFERKRREQHREPVEGGGGPRGVEEFALNQLARYFEAQDDETRLDAGSLLLTAVSGDPVLQERLGPIAYMIQPDIERLAGGQEQSRGVTPLTRQAPRAIEVKALGGKRPFSTRDDAIRIYDTPRRHIRGHSAFNVLPPYGQRSQR